MLTLAGTPSAALADCGYPQAPTVNPLARAGDPANPYPRPEGDFELEMSVADYDPSATAAVSITVTRPDGSTQPMTVNVEQDPTFGQDFRATFHVADYPDGTYTFNAHWQVTCGDGSPGDSGDTSSVTVTLQTPALQPPRPLIATPWRPNTKQVQGTWKLGLLCSTPGYAQHVVALTTRYYTLDGSTPTTRSKHVSSVPWDCTKGEPSKTRDTRIRGPRLGPRQGGLEVFANGEVLDVSVFFPAQVRMLAVLSASGKPLYALRFRTKAWFKGSRSAFTGGTPWAVVEAPDRGPCPVKCMTRWPLAK